MREEEKKQKTTIIRSIFQLPSNLTMASSATRIRFHESINVLTASFASLNGIVTFDIRNPDSMCLYDYHHYPVTSFDTGKFFSEHIAISAGTTKILQYELRVIDVRKSKEDNASVRIIPGHQAVITKMTMEDGMVVTGAKNGSVTAMNFYTFSPEMRVLPNLTMIKC